MKFTLDTRTKFFILLIAIFVTSLQLSLSFEVLMIGLFIVPFFLSGKERRGFYLLLIYLFQLVIAYILIPMINIPFFLYMLSFIGNGMRKLMPSIIAGTYVVSTTTVSEWIALFKHWHFPRFIGIPLAVMARFFPTIREDYRHIRRAMSFRGIGTGFLSLLKNPMKSLEHIIIPLLMNASQVAQDLTISALTKGLGLPGRHTSIVRLEMRSVDWIYLTIVILPVLFYLGRGWL